MSVIVRGLLLLSVPLAAMFACNATAQILPKEPPDFMDVGKDGLSLDQAEYVAAIAARHEGYPDRNKNYSLEKLTVEGKGKADPFPGFFYFSLEQQSPVGASVNHLRVYYVSKMTGDVWQALTPSPPNCYRVAFPRLRTIQQNIMLKTGATFATEKAQREGIGCAAE